MRPADKAWLTLAAGVVIWDVVCDDGEMLSQASARYAQDHPALAYAVVAAVALHLIDRLPSRVDPIHIVGVGLRRARNAL